MKNKSLRSCFRILIMIIAMGGFMASSGAQTNLYTPNPSFNMADHVVSTSFFHWYSSTGGQLSSPWLPREGRPQWTGESDWWKGQIKQTMMANIDMLYVHLYPGSEQQRINLFAALNQLRSEGYDVPKIAPFLDPIITWGQNPVVNLATAGGKNNWVDQYIRFFNQYYSVNQDAYADDYIAKFEDQVILDSWHPHLSLYNIASLSRSDVMTRLTAEFGSNSVFSNDIYMVTTVHSPKNYAFADEKVNQFEVHSYYEPATFNGITTAQVKPGYWDQNIRNPGFFLPRTGGTYYTSAWGAVNGNSTLSRVYIESFNEYDEGSGIYAADPTNSPWIKPGSGNTSGDTWSSTDDPFEYLRTTAAGAATFNDTPSHDAKIIWNSFLLGMLPGSTQTVSVIVRNAGDTSWTAAENYKFGDKANGSSLFGASRYPLDDNADEIPLYGGIFRGRAKTFQLTLIAPMTPGTYETHWGMIQEGGVEWFGDDLTLTILVDNTLLSGTVALGDLLHAYDGLPKNASATPSPAGLVVDLTYDGLTNAPTDPGSYSVIGTINDAIYQGSSTNTLVIQIPTAYDAWKALWFTAGEQANPAISGPEIYHDSDIFSNWEEYIAGTDPTDGQVFPRFDMQPVLNGYMLNWIPVSGRIYSIDWSSDLTQGFASLKNDLLWPQSSYTDQTHQAETEGFYQMGVSLPPVVTTATIMTGTPIGSGDLFHNAAITDSSPIYPSPSFLASNMFVGTAAQCIFADNTGDVMAYVDFNTSSSVNLGSVVVVLANDGASAFRALSRIKVYASHSLETVQDVLIADIPVDPDYVTAYGSSAISVSIDLTVEAQYFRVEFTEPNDAGVRIMEVDGFE